MMIRSAPPASANLAEMPVPAPTPRIGWPWRTASRRLAMHSSRESISTPLGAAPLGASHAREFRREARGELRVIDMRVHLDNFHLGMASNRIEQRGGGVRIVKRLSGRIDRRNA